MKHTFKLLPVALLAFSIGAQAAMTITIQEVGDDVVLSGSGSINSATGIPTLNRDALGYDAIDSTQGFVLAGTTDQPLMKTFGFFHENSGSFGNKSEKQQPTQNTGDLFGFHASSAQGFGLVYLPNNYASEQALTFRSTFQDTTLADLGIELGTYEWELNGPIGGGTDTITLKVIAAAVPAPVPATATPVPSLGAFGLMGLATAIGAAGVAMSRRRKTTNPNAHTPSRFPSGFFWSASRQFIRPSRLSFGSCAQRRPNPCHIHAPHALQWRHSHALES